ncbi:hypothetical protein GQ43DRAFT_437254 [Delitschia confertaspora ATCC 74209]|uniref:Spindle pole body-associated protein cut12 domain-containing protein n=1 Tax=Delitschia confertaspora ATCC 74209 TaxID=1513339 RepID=A0A9P4MZB5_9PLEO|nr:hypothetical protein GQ43DRAFT_437254 [Delitschia confertaspora ATCC 74209]
MLSWITGPRNSNVVEYPEPDGDTTYMEPPETPAPVFAVRAFKHAIFGTPAVPDYNSVKIIEKKVELDPITAKTIGLPPKKEDTSMPSPMKPNGILMTPGTASKGRKSVNWGAHVVDNEGKRTAGIGRSGIPNDCPGKFPSPWTPGTALLENKDSEKKPQTKLTEALYNARTTKQPTPVVKVQKSKDDLDITLDMSEPRSESGKYWKGLYEAYAEKSEKEAKKLVVKHHIAKTYAKKKDDEAMELANRLQDERMRHKAREQELEEQTKELQKRLRIALGENARTSMEIAGLKQRIAALEVPLNSPVEVDAGESSPFQIHEDSSKDSIALRFEEHRSSRRSAAPRSDELTNSAAIVLGKPTLSAREHTAGKENSPSKPPRRLRRSTREAANSMLSTNGADTPDFASIPTEYSLANPTASQSTPHNHKPRLSKTDTQHSRVPTTGSPLRPRASEPSNEPDIEQSTILPTGTPTGTPLTLRQILSKENIPTNPKPQLSPVRPAKPPPSDPWLDAMDSSPLPQRETYGMALPISNGTGYSSNSRAANTSKHIRSRSVKKTARTGDGGSKDFSTGSPLKLTKAAAVAEEIPKKDVPVVSVIEPAKIAETVDEPSKAEGASAFMRERERKSNLTDERREEAKRKLAERRKLKKGGA